jgi:hypothetical protein
VHAFDTRVILVRGILSHPLILENDMKLRHLVASLALAAANLAHATPITLLSFGQVGSSATTITAVDNGAGTTTIQTTTPLQPITITGIATNAGGVVSPFVSPFTGFLTLNATSTAVPPTITLGGGHR